MVYGSEAVLPVEVGITSPQTTFDDHDLNEEEKKINLDLRPEIRGTALLKVISYKLQVTRLFNRRVKHRPFQVNDWVLRKFKATRREPKLGKLQRNWEGPYRVTSMVRPGTYRREDQEGRPLPRSWNADNLRKFYV